MLDVQTVQVSDTTMLHRNTNACNQKLPWYQMQSNKKQLMFTSRVFT